MTDIKDNALASMQGQSTRNESVKVKDKVVTLKETLNLLKPELKEAMLSKIKPEYLIGLATTILRTRPELQDCTPISIISGIFQSAQTGLSLDPILHHAALIKRYNNKTKQNEAQFMPEFRGYMELARRSGVITNIVAQLVHENDFFEMEFGSSEHLTHRPLLSGDRGEIIGGYAYAPFKSGGVAMEWMSVEEMNSIMNRTKSLDSAGNIVGPWKTDTNEMRRKTLVRRLSKYLPLSTEMANAISSDERVATGDAPILVTDQEPLPSSSEAKIVEAPVLPESTFAWQTDFEKYRQALSGSTTLDEIDGIYSDFVAYAEGLDPKWNPESMEAMKDAYNLRRAGIATDPLTSKKGAKK